MREQIVVRDRDGNNVANDAGALARARNLSWRTRLPGGYADCSFEVPFSFIRGWNVALGYTVIVYDGLQEVFYGRLEDKIQSVQLPGLLTEGWVRLSAFGYHQNLVQRMATVNYTSGSVYASDIIKEAVRENCPLISTRQDNIQSTGYPLGAIGWDDQYVGDILADVLKFGDNQTPPAQMLWTVWGPEEETGTILDSDWHAGASGNTPLDWQWTGVVSGAGSVAMSSTSLQANTTAAAGAALVYANNTLPSDKAWWMWHQCTVASCAAGQISMLYIGDKAAAPAANDAGTRIIEAAQNTGGSILLTYRDSSSTLQYWNGAAWGTSVSAASVGSLGTAYRYVVYSNPTDWRIELQNSSATVLTTASAVTWALTEAGGNSWWLSWGDWSTGSNSGAINSACAKAYAKDNLPVAYFWPRDLSAYDIQIPLSAIQGTTEVSDTLSDTANYVKASYGTIAVSTAAASDADSIADYDQRDLRVETGNIPSAVADQARDMTLEARRGSAHRLGQLTLQGYARNSTGGRLPLNRIRAGQRFVIQELGDTVYLIGRTDYSADTGTLSITVDTTPDTVDIMLAKQQQIPPPTLADDNDFDAGVA